MNGKKKNITIGHFPGITTIQARELLKDKIKEIAKGGDPLATKQLEFELQDNTLQSYLSHDYKLHMERAIAGKDYLAVIANHFPIQFPYSGHFLRFNKSS